MCVYMGYYVFPKSNDSAVAKSTVSISLQKKKKKVQGSLEKWLNPGRQQGKYKIFLEHQVTKNNKMLRKRWACQQGIKAKVTELPMAEGETI